ncbi:MAG: hypothetical protein KGI38_11415 [Thaumarchaeota archaeon]|nr:hypothetical protein [Nitrososphaerota archaeon]
MDKNRTAALMGLGVGFLVSLGTFAYLTVLGLGASASYVALVGVAAALVAACVNRWLRKWIVTEAMVGGLLFAVLSLVLNLWLLPQYLPAWAGPAFSQVLSLVVALEFFANLALFAFIYGALAWWSES